MEKEISILQRIVQVLQLQLDDVDSRAEREIFYEIDFVKYERIERRIAFHASLASTAPYTY